MLGAFHWLLVLALTFPALAGFWEDRGLLMAEETRLQLGSQIQLDADEVAADAVLVAAKAAEYENSRGTFPWTMHFFDAKPFVEQSQVFKFIQMMPKGGVLHAHESAMVSTSYLLKNLTYRDHLFACSDDQGALTLRFLGSHGADASCSWIRLADMRRDAGDVDAFDRWLERKFTLFSTNPSHRDSDANAVWVAFEAIFKTVGGLLAYRPVYEDYIYQFLEEFYEDNVMYIELRTSIKGVYELDGTVLSSVAIAKLFERVVARFSSSHPDFLGAKLILSLARSADDATVTSNLVRFLELKAALPDLMAGFDLVAQEDRGRPLAEFVDALAPFIRGGNRVFCHAGETNWQGMTDLNVVDAILLNSTRIGHGFALTKHPLALRLLKERGIAIEVNPISNQVLMLVKDLRNHPGAAFLADDYPVVVSCDGPSFWGAKGVSYDFYAAFMGLAGLGADLRMLKQLALNSIRYSVLSDSEKTHALRVWERQWRHFIARVVGVSDHTLLHSEL